MNSLISAQKITEQLEWHSLEPSKVFSLLEDLLKTNAQLRQDLLAQAEISWDRVLLPLLQQQKYIFSLWSMYSHINNVATNAEIQQSYEKALLLLDEFIVRQNLDLNWHKMLTIIKDSTKNKQQLRALDLMLLGSKLAGVELDDLSKKKLFEFNADLAILTEKFSSNLMQHVDNWELLINSSHELLGIPEFLLAKTKVDSGWKFGINDADYPVIIQNAQNSKLRETFFKSYRTRASYGKFNNADNVVKILQLRQAKANLLGFDTYVDYTLQTRAINGSQELDNFLNSLVAKVLPIAKQEALELVAFAQDKLSINDIQPWDYSLVADKFVQYNTGFATEEYRPYFPLKKVLIGLRELVAKLFGINIVEVTKSAWHQDVFCWQIIDVDHNIKAICYLDLFARPGKQGGAWMDDCFSRDKSATKHQQPVAFLNCNFIATSFAKAYLSHDDVVTLFHEFGHVLNHCLSTINLGYISGLDSIEWDAVEVASQLLERWSWEPEVLAKISSHRDTGASLPIEMMHALVKSQQILAASKVMRQLIFSKFDIEVHRLKNIVDINSVYVVYHDLVNKYSTIPGWSGDCMPAAFSHLFAGGYAAGYYSYLYSEVMADDIFNAINGVGKVSARLFKDKFLSQAAMRPALDLFADLMGRSVKIDAFLARKGIG